MVTQVESQSDTYELVVVGCGVAGLAAAVTAAEDGTRVVVLERSRYEERGGNSRYTEAYLRMQDEQHVADGFVDDLVSYSDGYTDSEIARFLADASPPTIAWLREYGVRFGAQETQFLSQSRPRLLSVGGGLAIVEALAAAAERLGVTFLYQTTALSLIQDEQGQVVGVRARSRSQALIEVRGQAVILASGGFEGNTEMLTRYIGHDTFRLRSIARGGMYNKGEGIQMALDIGAEPSGQFDQFHAEPVDPRSDQTEATVMVYPYGILVNRNGERFVDEGRTTVDHMYEDVARAVWRQPRGIAWFVTDQRLFEIPGYRRGLRTDQPLIEAATPAELARALGIPEQALVQTLEQYNAATTPAHDWDPFHLDGNATQALEPPKSNWAVPIDRPAFVACPVACSVVFTFGGLKVNTNAQVFDTDGRLIPGLYAAGETVGLYYGSYPGATSVLRGLVFGRAAWLGGQGVISWKSAQATS